MGTTVRALILLLAYPALVFSHLLDSEFVYVDFRSEDIPVKLRDCMSVSVPQPARP